MGGEEHFCPCDLIWETMRGSGLRCSRVWSKQMGAVSHFRVVCSVSPNVNLKCSNSAKRCWHCWRPGLFFFFLTSLAPIQYQVSGFRSVFQYFSYIVYRSVSFQQLNYETRTLHLLKCKGTSKGCMEQDEKQYKVQV